MGIVRLLLPLIVVLAGCTYLGPPPVSIGPCVLIVLADDGPTPERLQPPYRVRQVTVIARPGSHEPDAQADIAFRGTGWQTVHMTLTDPAGDVRMDEDVPGDEINQGGMGTTLDAPGLWREHLEDDQIGCTQEFSVEVVAPSPLVEPSVHLVEDMTDGRLEGIVLKDRTST